MRPLRNARLENSKLNENELYQFSLNHTLEIYDLDAVCTFIPKNACSALRYSIAVANGFIKDIKDINWIHHNNQSFIPSSKDASLAKYTFLVLRCPFTRVASCFLDKVVNQIGVKFHDSNGNELSINFHEFLSYIKSQDRNQRDQHWRNQSDFLHFETYDDYFSLELFDDAIRKLKDQGFEVHDTREQLMHDLKTFKKIDGDFSKTKDIEIKQMRKVGIVPRYSSMYGPEEIQLVKDIYKDDIDLYTHHFGKDNLLF
jgi:hypothetical protein